MFKIYVVDVNLHIFESFLILCDKNYGYQHKFTYGIFRHSASTDTVTEMLYCSSCFYIHYNVCQTPLLVCREITNTNAKYDAIVKSVFCMTVLQE